jgi:hypothetical protein
MPTSQQIEQAVKQVSDAQLLLERLIFLYFLQNRGWLDQKRDYLTAALQAHPEPASYSYYHQFLDKLFWTLSTAPGEAGRFPGIPFLNGGLFDDDEFRQPADLRKVSPPLKVRNSTMRLVFGDFLEAFNFTVKEDTPLSQEVAVDPEMLGKVFESIVLHAEAADPDAVAPDKRKATGSYYTPRIVVHFICREALYQYLLNHLSGEGWGPRLKGLLAFDLSDGFDEPGKEELKNTIKPGQARQVLDLVKELKCCDPAVGSGAFPVGLMQELVNLRRLLETALNGYRDPVISSGAQWLHNAKEHIVENCLFGVDIQQQAIEICRLRLWLSLIVDYDIGPDSFKAERQQFRQAIERMSQLPNLEMNFRRGDSLHDHVCGVPVVILPDRTVRHFEEFKAISKLGAELHQAKKSEKKKRLRVAILEHRLKLSGKLVQEEIERVLRDDSALDGLFGIEESKAKKRERNERELANLKAALASIERDAQELEKLMRREADSQFYAKLRKLEGADFNSPFNFAWYVDFPNVFAGENGGFDIVVGNPPFVTARNPVKRELWRKRWPRVCASKYHLLCPFFELSFSLLQRKGEIGFIVSNAFAKRDFGQPLIENFFSGVSLQKVVDCSGLLFPGHGTPTCLVFGCNEPPLNTVIRVTGLLPGGGDLRTRPEESPLWASVSLHHDGPGYTDKRIVVSDRTLAEMAQWPWNFDPTTQQVKAALESRANGKLINFLSTNIGYSCVSRADDVYFVPEHLLRNFGIPTELSRPSAVGDELRNWRLLAHGRAIFPYDGKLSPVNIDKYPALKSYLLPFRKHLERRVAYGKTQEERGLQWFEYSMLFPKRILTRPSIAFPDIVSHNHFIRIDEGRIFKDTAPIFGFEKELETDSLLGFLNSSTALLWLKQICFNKGAGEEEERDRFEFMAGKVEKLPVPPTGNPLWETVATLSRELTLKGRELEKFSMTEALSTINNQFSLNETLSAIQAASDVVWQRMIALQEELDWAVYVLCGMLNPDHVAARIDVDPLPITQESRPFVLSELADGECGSAIQLIPQHWDGARRTIWEARLTLTRDDVNIKQFEQPVYKRRWDEQWKVGNQWRYGAIAYAAEFIDAFEWWLKEKAEWWLEHTKHGGPVHLDEWAAALWADTRIQAAWQVAAENYNLVEFDKARARAEEQCDPVPEQSKPKAGPVTFVRQFRAIIDEETAPEGFEFGTDYDELEKKLKRAIPPKLKKVRGKLNVPRERFHSVGKTQYKWAGLQFKSK